MFAVHTLLPNVYPVAHVFILQLLLTVPLDHDAVSHVLTCALLHEALQLVCPVVLVVPLVYV